MLKARLTATLALGGITAVVCAGAAPAGQVSRDTFHDERTAVVEDLCGVSGLDVRVDTVIDGRLQVGPRGRDRLAYFLQHGTTTDTYTNLATGATVRTVASVVEKDLRVTANGDGTITVLVLATGNATVYGPDGNAIGRNPGQLRFELLVDDGGTPTDPSDDQTIDFLGVVKESTGRSDDFCDAAVPALT